MQNIYQDIQNLLEYGVSHHLLTEEDVIYARNKILSLLDLNDWHDSVAKENPSSLQDILDSILDWCSENGLLSHNTTTERDIFDTELMNCLMPRPSEVIRTFRENYQENQELATNQFYELSISSNYIREDRVSKNRIWKTSTPYGEIDITINLSKPEKDPKEIALLQNSPSHSYPDCPLCIENEGFRGNLRHAARATHRIIPITLNGEDWFFQYSPYVYYREHCIVLKKQHVPMEISTDTFVRLLNFVEKMPHYFIGSNADLPIVGGSILTHDHFQGGRYTFAIERAETEETFQLQGYPNVTIGIVKWPMSVLRIQGEKKEVAQISEMIWRTWQGYSDIAADILAFSGETPHNTVTPIARRRGELYEMDLVLRNNRTTVEHPDGMFHPHQELHHIKKENIGVIEVMGLAVLPGRLANDLDILAQLLIDPAEKDQWDTSLLKHWDWHQQILKDHQYITKENVTDILRTEVGRKFQNVLEHAGVFKRTSHGKQAFLRFITKLQEKNS
ncbi:UDP-glucose--hexose-1-phosphate uridylyltransferase [Peribacillus cavernae]|uniref:Galactose-1-phosphate uridylyltransferase n=1 Tax=Peribacillus cavernae TaxID=1674310 RepID=A0A3S0U7Z6_9BACI|nr:UDP-glucose--hexose-1-phosphate uridylyltransferase [Peribacillus cavernae]MDQ0219997.1 UDPglucose--hexose-1-phosphate uridylyltransferase [Peribacillus cavernae]RUQ32061.1 UDP-glucose--hexose-1-phosphate uridylyltransferase [Peribacillus cavernae]